LDRGHYRLHTHDTIKGLAGNLALWIGIVLFTALWLLSFNGAPPPSVRVLVVVDLFLFPLVIGWMYWIDRHREVRLHLVSV
jgi:hypothetical protein